MPLLISLYEMRPSDVEMSKGFRLAPEIDNEYQTVMMILKGRSNGTAR